MLLIRKIRHWAQHMPHGIAVDDGGKKIPYAELENAIHSYVEKIKSADCRCIGIAGDNNADWILWDLAAIVAGICVVPIAPFFTTAQKDFVIQTAGITHVAQGGELIASGVSPKPLPAMTGKITFTSGSTGTPKGVCLTLEGLECVSESIKTVLGTEISGVHLCVLPLAVLLENIAGVYTALMMGATVFVPPLATLGMANAFAPDFDQFLKKIQATSATSIILVPELLRGLMMQIKKTGTRLPSLKFVAVGGAKVAPELLMQAQELGLPVYEGYGLSECGSVVSLNTLHHAKPGTSGKLLPHVKARIEAGEVIIENPVFVGYLGEKRREPDVYHTGDVGSIDDEGFISLQGRKSNLIITGFGRNVSPEWVESHLLGQPAILQAIVYGDGAAKLSALIVPAQAHADIQAAVQVANGVLPSYARIESFDIVSPFTAANGLLTGNGRMKRKDILRFFGKEKTMTFYEHLQSATLTQRQHLYATPQLTDALKGDISRDTYISYLTEAYHHVRHTVRFLMAMGARLPDHKQWLHDAIAEYIDEEKGHEEWILNDIAVAGGDKESVRHSAPNLETQVLVAYNYDYINRKNPVGFLGMVFMLESTSTQIATRGADAIQKGIGLPKNAFTYLSSHGELDIKHMKFFESLINKIDDPADQAAVIEVAQNTFRLFANVIGAIPHKKGERHAA